MAVNEQQLVFLLHAKKKILIKEWNSKIAAEFCKNNKQTNKHKPFFMCTKISENINTNKLNYMIRPTTCRKMHLGELSFKLDDIS